VSDLVLIPLPGLGTLELPRDVFEAHELTPEQSATLEVETFRTRKDSGMRVKASVTAQLEALKELRRIMGIGADLEARTAGGLQATQVNVHLHIGSPPASRDGPPEHKHTRRASGADRDFTLKSTCSSNSLSAQ
jgi:hypothetical protein